MSELQNKTLIPNHLELVHVEVQSGEKHDIQQSDS